MSDTKNIRFDFTDGLIFSRNAKSNGLNEILRALTNTVFPWERSIDLIQSDADLNGEDPEKTLFLTGTNEEIRFKQEYKEMMRGNMCECCGAKIHNIPWERKHYSQLCDRCSSRFEKDYGPDLFGMKQQKHLYQHPWWLV